MDDYNKYINRCIELAEKGRLKVSPNPMVGAVVVHNGNIIGEGYHEKFGSAHAEVNAVDNVKDKNILPESELYISLEPCSYHGKTPPCTDLIIRNNIKKVIIGSVDPNPKVSGKGIQILKDAGVDVVYGVLAEKCDKLNKRFFINKLKNRPYIIIKYAQTKDGFIARDDFSSKWISNKESRKLVHKWRAEEDGIMVATNTAKYDNPKLNVRLVKGGNPIRFVLDKDLKLPLNLNLFNDGEALTYIIHDKNISLESRENSTLKSIPLNFNNKSWLNDLFLKILELDVYSIIIEGGASWHQYLINNSLWDEARVFTSQVSFKSGIRAAQINGHKVSDVISSGNDTLEIFERSE